MKYLVFILLIMLSGRLQANPLPPQDSQLIDSNTIVSSLATPNRNFLGLCIDYTYSKNLNSLNLGGLSISMPYFAKTLTYQFNLINYSWIAYDKYNNSQYNHSFLTNYMSLVSIGSYLIRTALLKDKSPSAWTILYFSPSIITNSQISFVLYQQTTSYLDYDFFNASVYYRSKLDAFYKNSVDFWRYSPGMGIELSQFFIDRNNPRDLKHFGLLLDLGLEMPVDYVHSNITKGDISPYFMLKFIFGGPNH